MLLFLNAKFIRMSKINVSDSFEEHGKATLLAQFVFYLNTCLVSRVCSCAESVKQKKSTPGIITHFIQSVK